MAERKTGEQKPVYMGGGQPRLVEAATFDQQVKEVKGQYSDEKPKSAQSERSKQE